MVCFVSMWQDGLFDSQFVAYMIEVIMKPFESANEIRKLNSMVVCIEKKRKRMFPHIWWKEITIKIGNHLLERQSEVGGDGQYPIPGVSDETEDEIIFQSSIGHIFQPVREYVFMILEMYNAWDDLFECASQNRGTASSASFHVNELRFFTNDNARWILM